MQDTNNDKGTNEWQAVCSSLKCTVGDSAFASWIEPIVLGEVKEGVARLFAPTRFMRDWIVKHYLGDIEESWQRLNPDIKGIAMEVSASRSNMRVPAQITPAEYMNDQEAQEEKVLQSGINSFTAPSFSPTSFSAALATRLGDETETAKPKFTTPDSQELKDMEAPLDSRYTFANFVVAPSNEFAYFAAKKIAAEDKVSFNPLFLHSGVGLGKTHLMQAIASYIKSSNPARKVLYLSAEKFMYKFISALRSGDSIPFKELFRSVDVLLIDDVQFIAGKDRTQEEFFHTFNALISSGKQIVLTADVPPSELKGIEARLKSRFAAGLEIGIHPSTYELRLGILANRSAIAGVVMPKPVMELLASRITGNIRELEGAFNRLVAHTELTGLPLTVESAEEILKDIFINSEVKVSMDEIEAKVAAFYNVKVSDLRSARRQRQIARPRQVAMYLAKTMTTRSLPEIGRKFDRDHTTVMHAIKTIEDLLKTDSSLAEDLKLITRTFNS